VSTVISAFNSLTLSPALCALLLKPHGHGHAREDALPRLGIVLIGGLLAVLLLTPVVGPLVGLPSGGHGEEHGSAAAASPALAWGAPRRSSPGCATSRSRPPASPTRLVSPATRSC